MITAIIDNQLWLHLLKTKSPHFKLLINSVSQNQLVLYSSPELQSNLLEMLSMAVNKKLLKKSLVTSFTQTILPFLSLCQSVPRHVHLFSPQFSPYINLCLFTNPDYLIPYNYHQFKPLDGYHKINVLEFDNLLNLLKT